MVVSLKALLEKAEGQIIANLSGGLREIFLTFTLACLSQSGKIFKTTNYSDIERSLHEVTLPNITAILEDLQKRILKDVSRISLLPLPISQSDSLSPRVPSLARWPGWRSLALCIWCRRARPKRCA